MPERTEGFTNAELVQIAQLIDAALDARPARRYVDTRGAAEYLGRTPAWVRDHRSELAPCTVGEGADGVLRFDTQALDAYVIGCTDAHAKRKANRARAHEGNAE